MTWSVVKIAVHLESHKNLMESNEVYPSSGKR